ncbi:conserved hypothetical protein [Histoplasma mississippiense (nom. inval.)]|uniref:conserved hypothetical protein n=1 Tax=Ajellomyces capsulatus (strain NAm1 / WU24) TaxID=2059318 RepID=UPI000157C9EF|nr:conserved hypothetical protein [Histoplasma mississippiense (nom. inval.)]EDN09052.1 conserved hypothetical protein [Histoplasma mississippiense (nom. inval.)]
MQPTRVFERHLVFKAYRKPGFVKTRPGGSQDVQAPETQRLNKLLNGGLYYMQVVGNVRERDFGSVTASTSSPSDALARGSDEGGEGTQHGQEALPPTTTRNGAAAAAAAAKGGYIAADQSWRLEFKDTPEAGARFGVTTRFVENSNLPSGNILPEMNAWGFNYVSEYVVEGHRFILDDIVLFLHHQMLLLDTSGAYILQASITVQDSGNPDMLKANSQRLLGLKEHLKSVVKLEPKDRLSLDTRSSAIESHKMKSAYGLCIFRLFLNRKSPDGGDISPPPLKRKAIGTATIIDNSLSQKKPEQVTWRTVNNSCIIGKYHQEQALEAVKSGKKRRIAAFDLDSTLVATKSGRRFPTNERDWKWWSPSVPDKLKQLNDEGYLVVVLSNQKAISLKKDLKGGRVESKSLSIFKQKVAAIMQTLDMPFSVYAATASDEFRKPRMGMWREMLDDHDLSVAGLLHLEQSIFVGDAAGREGDHSCVDRDFAANVGVPFETPEEFFLDEAPKPILRTFDPKAYIVDSSADEPTITFSKKSDVELVIFCGSPGSGKSTFYWRYLEPLGYERVNQDILKSLQKNIYKLESLWQSSPSNLLPDVQESINPESRSSLPGIAFGDFQRRFQVPVLSEGFQDITHVEFKFQGTPATKEVWGQYWV